MNHVTVASSEICPLQPQLQRRAKRGVRSATVATDAGDRRPRMCDCILVNHRYSPASRSRSSCLCAVYSASSAIASSSSAG